MVLLQARSKDHLGLGRVWDDRLQLFLALGVLRLRRRTQQNGRVDHIGRCLSLRQVHEARQWRILRSKPIHR